jgi:hypothetical protein
MPFPLIDSLGPFLSYIASPGIRSSPSWRKFNYFGGRQQLHDVIWQPKGVHGHLALMFTV